MVNKDEYITQLVGKNNIA